MSDERGNREGRRADACEVGPGSPADLAASPLRDYLVRLRAELAARGLPAAKCADLLAEIRHHLECAALQARRDGGSRASAERRAVARFGSAESVAAGWIAADRVAPPTSALGLLSAGGTVLGMALGIPVGLSVLPFFGGELVLPVVGATLGLALGVLQWLLVRRVLATRPGWILGTAFGAAVGLTVGTVVVEGIGLQKGALLDDLVAMALIGGLAGGSIGWLQWRLGLPPASRSKAWVVSHAVALAVGLVLGSLLAILRFGDLRTLAGLATVTVAAGCSLGCAGSLASRRALFGAG